MLTPSLASIAEKLIHGDLSDDELRQLLLATTLQRVSADSFSEFVELARASLAEPYRDLAAVSDAAFDCCGTGGSGLQHFNTSTAVSFVLGAAGVMVVKFGNRGASSASGSFDLLEELGISALVSAPAALRLLDACNQAFLFAPQCYPRLARLAPLRKSLQQRTIFNYIGPLLNPAAPQRRLLGISDQNMQACVASYLSAAGRTRKALVVRSANNLDELEAGILNEIIEVQEAGHSSSHNDFAELVQEQEQQQTSAPQQLSPEKNAEIFRAILAGSDTQSRFAGLVRLNGGAALYAAGKAESLSNGYKLAGELLASGSVQEQFTKVRAAYARLVS